MSALFIAVALVLRTFTTFYIPLFGYGSGMRIGIHGIFSMMPAILFGPIFGGITSGLTDLFGFMIRPSGPFLPLMTLIVTIGGVVRGGLWLLLRNRNPIATRAVVAVFAVGMLLLGFISRDMLNSDGITPQLFDNVYAGTGRIDTSEMSTISRWLVIRTQDVANPSNTLSTMITVVTTAPVAVAALGLLLLGIDLVIAWVRKKNGEEQSSIMPILIAMLTSSIMVSTLNTILLSRTVFTSWQLMPFVVVWLPRVIQTIVTTTLYAYFVSFFLSICRNQPTLKQLIR